MKQSPEMCGTMNDDKIIEETTPKGQGKYKNSSYLTVEIGQRRD
jgi:hypothetical protein